MRPFEWYRRSFLPGLVIAAIVASVVWVMGSSPAKPQDMGYVDPGIPADEKPYVPHRVKNLEAAKGPALWLESIKYAGKLCEFDYGWFTMETAISHLARESEVEVRDFVDLMLDMNAEVRVIAASDPRAYCLWARTEAITAGFL